jgi:uncharacterized protein involved in type VI secretion and phage assembly
MPVNEAYIAVFIVEINGSAVSTDFMMDVRNIEVEQSLHMPSMFSIHLDDPKFTWVDNAALLKIGASVKISAKDFGGFDRAESATHVLIDGEITALEPDYPETSVTSLVVRGYDKSHRLHRGRKTRTFLDVTDSDLCSTIAGEVGLRATADATSVVHPYVLQDNQTNFEFLWERARNNGYVVYSAEGQLRFQKPRTGATAITLSYGESLREFRPRVSWAGQSSKVVVRGWDEKQQLVVTAEAAPTAWPNTTGISGAPAVPFGEAASAHYSMSTTTAHATAIANGLKSEVEEGKLQAEGTAFGTPTLAAGKTVTLQKLGSRFSGTYLVTHARHRLDSKGGYDTEFSISGFNSNTLRDLIEGGAGTSGAGRPAGDHVYAGVMPAIVTNLDDPEDRGRVKVKFPWMGDAVESFWARAATPMSGGSRGFMFLPEVNDEVLVAFENGDSDRPYVLGGLWHGTEKPPIGKAVAVKNGKVVQRMIKSRLGHVILLDDSDDKTSIQFIDKTTKNSIVIDSVANKIIITAEADIEATAKGNIKATATGNIEAKATGNVKVEATGTLTAKSTGAATVESSASMTVKAAATMTIEGAMVEIKASGIVKIQGSLVQIN